MTTPYFSYRNLSPIDDGYILEQINKYARAADQLNNLCEQKNLDEVTCTILIQSSQAIEKIIGDFKNSYDPFRLTSAWILLLHNYAWNFSTIITQAVVAMQFQGTKYQLNIKASEAYESLFKSKYVGRRRANLHDIEIDILIDQDGGKQIWVEVKSSRASLVGKLIELTSTELAPEDELIILREQEFASIDEKEKARFTKQMHRQNQIRQALGLKEQVLILAGFRHMKSNEDMLAALDSEADGVFVLHPDPLPFVNAIRQAVRENMFP